MKVTKKKNTSKRMLIMDSKRINDCSLRIAYQIFESNINEKEIIIIGIKKNGYTYAKKISEYLKSISKIQINLICPMRYCTCNDCCILVADSFR